MATTHAVEATHPSLRYTRLGSHIRKLSSEYSVGGLIARSIMQQDHSKPLELTPVAMLADWMSENEEHPLSGELNWKDVPTKLKLDQVVNKAVLKNTEGEVPHPNAFTQLAYLVRGELNADAYPWIENALKDIKTSLPNVSDDDIIESAHRNHIRKLRTSAYIAPSITGHLEQAGYENNPANARTFRHEITEPAHEFPTEPHSKAEKFKRRVKSLIRSRRPSRPNTERKVKYSVYTDANFHGQLEDSANASAASAGDRTTGLAYADFLEERGQPTLATIIRRSIAKSLDKDENSSPGTYVYKGMHGLEEAHRKTGDRILNPGEFIIDDTRGGITLRQRSAITPNTMLIWSHPLESGEDSNKIMRDAIKEGANVYQYNSHLIEPEQYAAAQHAVKFGAGDQFGRVNGIRYTSHPSDKYSENDHLGATAELAGVRHALTALNLIPAKTATESLPEYNGKAWNLVNHFTNLARDYVHSNPTDLLSKHYLRTADRLKVPHELDINKKPGERVVAAGLPVGTLELSSAVAPLLKKLAVDTGLREAKPLLIPQHEYPPSLPDEESPAKDFDYLHDTSPYRNPDALAASILSEGDDKAKRPAFGSEKPAYTVLGDVSNMDFDLPDIGHSPDIEEIENYKPKRKGNVSTLPHAQIRQDIANHLANGGTHESTLKLLQDNHNLEPAAAERVLENYKNLKSKPAGKKENVTPPKRTSISGSKVKKQKYAADLEQAIGAAQHPVKFAASPPAYSQLLNSAIERWKGFKPTADKPSPGVHLDPSERNAEHPILGNTVNLADSAAVLAGTKPAAIVNSEWLLKHPLGQEVHKRLLAAGHISKELPSLNPGVGIHAIGQPANVNWLHHTYSATGPLNHTVAGRALGYPTEAINNFLAKKNDFVGSLHDEETRQEAKPVESTRTRPSKPSKFAATRSPEGGAVVDGLFYPGGQIIPTVKQVTKLSRKEQFARKWKIERKKLKWPPYEEGC